MYGSVGVVQVLLNSSDSHRINARDAAGYTALLHAFQAGSEATARLILAHPRNTLLLTQVDKNEALRCAAGSGNVEACRFAVTLGGDLRAIFSRGKYTGTVLHIAIDARASTETLSVLLAAGADVNASDALGASPLMLACQYNLLSVCQLLLASGAAVNQADAKGFPPLHYAAGSNSLECLNVILAAGAMPALSGFNSETPLHAACIQGGAGQLAATMLLDAGAPINARNAFGTTPLLKLCLHSPVDPAGQMVSDEVYFASMLLTRGANPNLPERDAGMTPLLIAAYHGNSALCKLLLDHNADIEAKATAHGRTALLLAAEGGHDATCELLLRRGANVNAVDSHGQGFYVAAAATGQAGIDKLFQLGIRYGRHMSAADLRDDTGIMRYVRSVASLAGLV
jgi:ankyrin repeat protein